MSESEKENRTPILIIGDAGPSRNALLQRNDIAAFWTTSLVGALATLRQHQPKACIIHPSDCEDGLESFVAACVREGGPPCIVILRADDWSQQGHWISAGASEVVQIELTQAIMELLGSYTGLRFAKEERATVELAVDIHHDGTTQSLISSDISASGLGVRSLDAAVGDLAQAHLMIDGAMMALWSRVVRVWKDTSGQMMAGLRFIGLTASQVDQLRAFVRGANQEQKADVVTMTNLFEGVTQASVPPTLQPGEFKEDSGRDDQWITEAADNLQALESYAENPANPLEPFLLQLHSSLSEIELSALRSHGEPAWVYQIVHTLVCIESWHHNHPQTVLPKGLYERANKQFCELTPHEAEGESIAVQVSIIRAHLLKYLLADNEAARA